MKDKVKSVFAAEQELKEDRDFELAISTKEPIAVYQGGMRIRPISTVIGYNLNTIKIADGVTIHRTANIFCTLSASERLKFITN